jgi:hypothetical protein
VREAQGAELGTLAPDPIAEALGAAREAWVGSGNSADLCARLAGILARLAGPRR